MTAIVFVAYQVNVIVDSTGIAGAPVIYEDSPTYVNLVGAVEHLAEMGTLVTDFGLIRGGALHRANGGYLLVDAHKLLQQPFAWDALKRALRAMEVRIESPAQMLAFATTVSLTPQPVPLDVKVVLIGARWLYYLLSQLDFEFHELFKVAVDFDDDLSWSSEATSTYARLIATIARREKLKPFDSGAVGMAIEHGARLADNSTKLSMRIGQLADVLREADYWASQAGRDVVDASCVQQAIDAQRRRSERIPDRAQEIDSAWIGADRHRRREGRTGQWPIGRSAWARPSSASRHA